MTCELGHLTGDYSTVILGRGLQEQGQYGRPRLKRSINPVQYYETDQIERITQSYDEAVLQLCLIIHMRVCVGWVGTGVLMI